MSDPAVTVVVPVYGNAATLRPLHGRLRGALAPLGAFEIVFVDDASPDASAAILDELHEADTSVHVIHLASNVGQQRAVLTGIARARGDVTVVLDADLQDPPEFIGTLVRGLGPDASAVFAGRRGRYCGVARMLTSLAFKQVLHLICGTPRDAGLFVAMDRAMRERLLAYDAPGPSVLAMMGCTGLPLSSVACPRGWRTVGLSAYRLRDRAAMAVRVLAWTATRRWRTAWHG